MYKRQGFLYCSSKVNLHPIIFGGGQQSGMRSGTENVPGAAGMGLAAEIAYKQFEQKKAHLNELRRYFLEGVHQLEGITVNGWDETVDGDECLERRAPHIVSAVSYTHLAVTVRQVRKQSKQSTKHLCASHHVLHVRACV